MAKAELVYVSGNTWYIPGSVNVGVYERNGSAALIDSGGDDEAGRQILRLVGEKGWKIDLIVNTHSNADHIGGNRFIQKRTGCRIASTAGEGAFILNPDLEPSFLFGGYPAAEMRNKFLRAQPSTVTDTILAGQNVPGTDLEPIPLPGHFFDMIGIRTPDDVVFLADSLFSERIIQKYHIVFLYDIRGQLETLDVLSNLRAESFIPSHGILTEDISGLIAVNRGKTEELIEGIAELCVQPLSADEVLVLLCERYGLAMNTTQYLLLGSTVKSYLAFLSDAGRVAHEIIDGVVKWKAVRGIIP